MIWLAYGLGVSFLLLVWDFQRRWFADRSRQRDHEKTRVLELLKAGAELIESQKARDTRTEKALVNFLTEQKDLVAKLGSFVQKQSAATVEKLQHMRGRRP